jgi:hypothetical protein
MKNNQSGFTVLSGALALAGVTAVLVGGMVYSAGAVRISVHEKRPGGDSFRIILPAAVVPVAMAFVPDRVFRDLPPEARQNLPALLIAAKELSKVPDGPLVEVRDARDHVVIAVEGHALKIDVDSDGDEVHLQIPLGAVESVASRLASSSEI